jgi:hypothetical protein
MMEALSPSETLDFTRATRRNVPEDSILYSHNREYLKSYKALKFEIMSFIVISGSRRLQIITKFASSHEKRFQNHINIEASRLLNVNNITSRLKWKKPFELVRRYNTD